MTRINLIPVEELCDQHLLAEHRELTRIPNGLLAGKLKYNYVDRSDSFTLGKGHVKFFTDKLDWLFQRYNHIHQECLMREFNVTYKFRCNELVEVGYRFDNYWTPSKSDIEVSRERILSKMPKHPRFTKY